MANAIQSQNDKLYQFKLKIRALAHLEPRRSRAIHK